MFRKLLGHELTSLRKDIDADGCAVVGDAVDSKALVVMREFIEARQKDFPNAYFSIAGQADFLNSPLAEYLRCANLYSNMSEIYEAVFGAPPTPQELYPVLRVVAGRSGLRQASRYHFDAYKMTALLPIIIPSLGPGRSGDLIIYPKFRRPIKSAFWNIVQKTLMQNAVVRKLFSVTAIQSLFNAKRIRMEPGSLYVFDGFTSFHGNEHCSPDTLRATLMLHLEDPFSGHSLLAAKKRRRIVRERRRRERRARHT